MRGFPPYARRCRAATLDPRSAARRSGIAAPASATAPPLTRLGAACAGGGCPRRWRGCGWNSLAVRSLASASGVALGGHAGLCPAGKAARVKIGGVFFAALCRALPPCGLRVGARAGMRYAAEPPRAQPRLRSALVPTRFAVGARLRASFKSAETADFQRRLSVRAFQGHFLGKIGRFWAYGGPRDPILPKKRPSKALQGRLQLAPSVPLRVKLGATCLTAAYLPGADSGPRPAPSRPRGARRDWGRARWALRGMTSQSSRNN